MKAGYLLRAKIEEERSFFFANRLKKIFADIKRYLLIHGFCRQANVVCRKKKRFIFLLN